MFSFVTEKFSFKVLEYLIKSSVYLKKLFLPSKPKNARCGKIGLLQLSAGVRLISAPERKDRKKIPPPGLKPGSLG